MQISAILRILIASLGLVMSFGGVSASAIDQRSDSEWTWKDASGAVRTRAELDSILSDHRAWYDTLKSKNTVRPSGFENGDLTSVVLEGDSISGISLRSATLDSADFSRAILDHAHLAGASIRASNLFQASLAYSDLSMANLDSATTGFALADAWLDLRSANLEDASLIGTELQDAKFSGAQVKGAIFEPKYLPEVIDIAYARGLRGLRYNNDPTMLAKLREGFRESGFRQQRREITCALRRSALEHEYSSNKEVGTYIKYWIYWLAFDFTCEYGANQLQPLLLLGIMAVLCFLVYWIVICCPGSGEILLICTFERGTTVEKSIPRPFFSSMKYAALFSVMNTFNIGFRDFNIGRWIRLLLTSEQDLKPIGWVRTVRGIQSLISVYLIAMWFLSEFTYPFD